MRLVVEALREELDGLVPFHREVGRPGLFPDFDELEEVRLVLASGAFEEFERAYRQALAHHADGVERTVDESALVEMLLRVFANLDVGAVLLGGTFETCGEVHGVAHHGVVLAGLGTHVSGHYVAGVDTDTHVHVVDDLRPFLVLVLVELFGPFLAELHEFALHADSRVTGVLCVVRQGHRRSEERDDGVAFVFVERSLVVEQRVGHLGQVFVQQVDELTRVADLFGEGGEACDVGEVGRDVELFTAELGHNLVVHHLVDQFGGDVLLEGVVQEFLFLVLEVELDDLCCHVRKEHRDELLRNAQVEAALEIAERDERVGAHHQKRNADGDVAADEEAEQHARNGEQDDDDLLVVLREVHDVVVVQDVLDDSRVDKHGGVVFFVRARHKVEQGRGGGTEDEDLAHVEAGVLAVVRDVIVGDMLEGAHFGVGIVAADVVHEETAVFVDRDAFPVAEAVFLAGLEAVDLAVGSARDIGEDPVAQDVEVRFPGFALLVVAEVDIDGKVDGAVLGNLVQRIPEVADGVQDIGGNDEFVVVVGIFDDEMVGCFFLRVALHDDAVQDFPVLVLAERVHLVAVHGIGDPQKRIREVFVKALAFEEHE